MVILSSIVQVILFFAFWRLLHWLTVRGIRSLFSASIFSEMIINLCVAIVFVIFAHVVHSVWWLMIIFGAGIGVLTGQIALRNVRD